MEVQQAKAFLAVAEELHFGRAADRLRMAQPPLSRSIKNLEAQLGAELFERSTRQVSLTPAGEALVEPARRLITASEDASRAVTETVNGEIGYVNMGFASTSMNQIVGEVARAVKRRSPRVKLELHSSQFSHIGLQKVLTNDLDLSIGRWEYLPPEVNSIVLGKETLLVALPTSHPLANSKSLYVKELANEQWVVLPGGSGAGLQSRLNALAIAAGFVPRTAYTAPDSWTLVMLVAAEMGCALSLDSVRDNISNDDVVFIPLNDQNNTLDVQMIWRRDNQNPALPSVIDTIRATFPHSPE